MAAIGKISRQPILKYASISYFVYVKQRYRPKAKIDQ